MGHYSNLQPQVQVKPWPGRSWRHPVDDGSREKASHNPPRLRLTLRPLAGLVDETQVRGHGLETAAARRLAPEFAVHGCGAAGAAAGQAQSKGEGAVGARGQAGAGGRADALDLRGGK